MNESAKNKMRDFVTKLISNPSFGNIPKLVVEENIILFFIQNMNSLKTTFSAPEYFPNISWEEIESLFLEVLYEEIDKYLIPDLQNTIQKKINFQFLNTFLNRQLPNETYQKGMMEFLVKALKKFEIRRNLNSVIQMIDNNMINKYINEVYEKKGYISREFLIVERLKLAPDMTAEFIKVILLLSILGYLRNDMNSASLVQKMKSKEVKLGNSFMQKAYYEKIIKHFLAEGSFFTDDIISRAVSFHLNFNEDRSVYATSRFAKIFQTLGKSYKPGMKIDKGADPFEKSWFQAQRKNYKFFGFDIDMLNDLYGISTSNRW